MFFQEIDNFWFVIILNNRWIMGTAITKK